MERILFHHTQTHRAADRHTHISIKLTISCVFLLHYYAATIGIMEQFVCVPLFVRYITRKILPRAPRTYKRNFTMYGISTRGR